MHLSADADLAHVIEQLNARLGLPANLREMGVSYDMIPGLVEQAMVDLAALSNPRKASARDYAQLFRDAIG
jgi:alcohol dehydrogenase class IV